MHKKTFRLFISSTFNDLKIERDLLQSEVFPEIKDFCRNIGYDFQVIDLRWGVSNEAGLDHRAMKICLDEVERSLDYPKPNFLILMGDRYGWVPLETEIEENLFDSIKEYCTHTEDLQLLQKWYKLDTNSIPKKYILQPVDKCIEVHDGNLEKQWQEIETHLLRIFQSAIEKGNIKTDKFRFSATEQEINKGVFNPQQIGKVLVLDRQITNLIKFKQKYPSIYSLYTDDNVKLLSLKQRLKSSIATKYHTFNTYLYEHENSLKLSHDYFEEYKKVTQNFLQTAIKEEVARINALDIKEIESNYHKNFLNERTELFIGRQKALQQVQQYLQMSSKDPYVIFGDSGVGKSAFLASVINHISGYDTIYRFIGITEKSSTVIELLKDIIFRLNKFSNKQQEELIENEYDVVVSRFVETIHDTKINVCIIIDALDQFVDSNNLEWLDFDLPTNVKIIVSTLRGHYLEKLKSFVGKENLLELQPLLSNDSKEILTELLKKEKRTLTSQQYQYILKKFTKNGLALYVKIASNEAIKWHSYNNEIHLEDTLEGIIREFIENLIEKEYHDRSFVEHILAYISASKNGLSEDELYELLSRDAIVMQSISNPYHKIPSQKNSHKLPAAIWARLYYDLVPYLSFIAKDSTTLFNFYHRKISEVTGRYYYESDKNFFHAKLYELFKSQALRFKNGKVNYRKVSELPYQLLQAKLFKKFVLEYDIEMLFAKKEASQILEALLEINNAYEQIQSSSLDEDVKEELLLKLVNTMFSFLFYKVKKTDSDILSVENIHAIYVYRKDKSFYERLLEVATDINKLEAIFKKEGNKQILRDEDKDVINKYHIAFKARYANKIRREAKLDEAFGIYLELLQLIHKHGYNCNKADLNELSKVEYDMAYIQYLKGNFSKAIEYMKQSVIHAKKATKPISEAISKCVEYRMRFLSDNRYVDEFEKVLDESYRLFYKYRFKSPNAKRWITNVLAHKFEIAYFKRDIKNLKKYYNQLSIDSWREEYKKTNTFASSLQDYARLLIVEEKYNEASTAFHTHIYENMGALDIRKKRESVARDYYDYLIALEGADKLEHLVVVLNELEYEIPEEPGNQLWKAKARQKFRKYLTKI